jgi:hypothetical protein
MYERGGERESEREGGREGEGLAGGEGKRERERGLHSMTLERVRR